MKKQQEITFIEAIQRDDKTEIKSIVVKPFSAKVRQALPQKDELNLLEEAEFVSAVTGLSAKELDKLTVPDYNALVEAAYPFLVSNSYELAGEELDSRKRVVKLFFDEHEREINFKFPKLKHSRLADEISDPFERTVFILEQITSLCRDEIESMPLPDYRSLELVAGDFLQKPAHYFTAKP
ncbi:phage tail assembly protein [Vibrio harveyi]|uniref:phage tail assembly protein n=1 Tax=Vibrio harveyi TaxID=669 RepID=UPI0003471CCE|nr:phage tail assembly protein [Vibrio harveyi]GEA22307.1 hypothetical protein VH1807_contig00024-0025 [Vibrio harveyi]